MPLWASLSSFLLQRHGRIVAYSVERYLKCLDNKTSAANLSNSSHVVGSSRRDLLHVTFPRLLVRCPMSYIHMSSTFEDFAGIAMVLF